MTAVASDLFTDVFGRGRGLSLRTLLAEEARLIDPDMQRVAGYAGRLVVCSDSAELYLRSARGRSGRGQVNLFDPFVITGRSDPWSPLTAADGWNGALRTARIWLEGTPVGNIMPTGALTADQVDRIAKHRFAPMLMAAAADPGAFAMSRLVQMAFTGSPEQVIETLENSRQAGAKDALRSASQLSDWPADERRIADAAVQSAVRVYRFNKVAGTTVDDDIWLRRLARSRSGTLYIVGNSVATKMLQGVFVTLLADLAHEVERAPAAQLPLLLCADRQLARNDSVQAVVSGSGGRLQLHELKGLG